MCGFTGIKDLDLRILWEFDDTSLFRICDINKEFSRITQCEMFWKRRYEKNFGKMPLKYKPANRTWRSHYMIVYNNLQMFQNKPVEFLNMITWNGQLKNSMFRGKNITPLVDAPEWVITNLWLLNVGHMKIYDDNYSYNNISNQTVYEMYYSLRIKQTIFSFDKFKDGYTISTVPYYLRAVIP